MSKRRRARVEYRVHPFAETFPMLEGSARDELREDIRTHGVREPIVLWLDNRESGESGDIEAGPGAGTEYLLDGRNRLAIANELGIEAPVQRLAAYRLRSYLGKNGGTRWEPEVVDAEAYIVSRNVHRRHLTAAQRRKAIKSYIALHPTASSRKVARGLGVSHVTVAKVRGGAENGQTVQIPHSPRARAKAELRKDSSRSQRAIAKAAGVDEGTVRKVVAEASAPAAKASVAQRRKATAEAATAEADAAAADALAALRKLARINEHLSPTGLQALTKARQLAAELDPTTGLGAARDRPQS